MKNVSLFLSTILVLAAFSAAGSFAADSEDYIGQGSSAPHYEIEDGQLKPASDGHGEDHAQGHDDGHHGDKHEVEGLPQLNFTTYPSQIFWLFIAFTILYFIFSKKTLPEISSTIENRREQVEGDMDNATKLKEEAEEVQTAYEDILAEARKKSADEFTKAEEKIKKVTNKKLEAFKELSNEKTAETEQVVEKAKQDAIGDMHSIAAEVASTAAEKIVGISTDIDQAKTLVKNIDRKAA